MYVSGLNSAPVGPERSRSHTPASRSICTLRGTYLAVDPELTSEKYVSTCQKKNRNKIEIEEDEEKKRGLHARAAMVRCRDTSSRPNEKEKISSDLAGERERLTDSIVVEPVLSKEHLPKVLADLVPCLSSSYHVVNHHSVVQRRNALSELTWPAYRTQNTDKTKDVGSEFL